MEPIKMPTQAEMKEALERDMKRIEDEFRKRTKRLVTTLRGPQPKHQPGATRPTREATKIRNRSRNQQAKRSRRANR